MAVTIVRTPWIDDDGTGTTGTVINNAVKTAVYNDIDGALAKVAQLTGGNTFTGTQTITGSVTINTTGTTNIAGTVAGDLSLWLTNSSAAANARANLILGTNQTGFLTQLISNSSAISGGWSGALPNGSELHAYGAGGLALVTDTPAPIRCFTSGTERLRIDSVGHLIINTTATISAGWITLALDQGAGNAIVIQNTSTSNSMNYLVFANSLQSVAGIIAQTGASTVSYGTSSDARLKDDAGRATDLAGLRAVVVHDFAWKADGRADRGVFAQDAHAVFPRAVTVGTDETTDTGELARPWMTDYSKFVPDLIVGWQHHDADLAELRALLVTLKGSADAE